MIGENNFFNILSGFAIVDDMGQWNHPNKITQINSNLITMKNVDYPVLGISDKFDIKLMKPNENYVFNGNKVIEIPFNLK